MEYCDIGILRYWKILAIHKVVENRNRNCVTLEDIEAYAENIDENGNIEGEITEKMTTFCTVLQWSQAGRDYTD